jgi:phage terminase small subunit
VPLSPVGTLAPPAGLTPVELALWAYYVPLLASVRVLTDVDRDTLAHHCIGLAQVQEIRAAQQAPSYRRLQAKRTHPLDAQLRAWLQLTRLSAAELGLSPVSRARVAPAGPVQEIDALEAFIKTAPLHRVK